MPSTAQTSIEFAAGGEQLLQVAGLRPDTIFHEPRIHVWRDLPERQNCTLDPIPGSATPRLHIKRFKAPFGRDALAEAKAISLLRYAGIPTVPLVVAGVNADGTGFLVSADLSGFIPADKALHEHADNSLPESIADLASRLHSARLHHRDLYLCHFFTNPADESAPIYLIDPGRVARLPRWPLHYRWLIKDLAQLSYSVGDANLPVRLRGRILTRYLNACTPFTRMVLRLLVPLKVAAIARHDHKLRQKRPGRRVSLSSNP